MSIRLSKYGVNPSIRVCPICGKSTNEIILFGTSWKDEDGQTAEAPRNLAAGEPCDNCKEVIKNGGVFFIEVRKGSDPRCPYRTGRLVAIRKEAADGLFPGHKSANFMEDDAFEKVFDEAIKNSNDN